jgi:uncharacterized protein YqeY
MSFSDRINEDLKLAMLAREKDKLEAIRAVKTAFILARSEKGAGSVLSEQEEIKILQKLIKQRKDAAAIYREQNRNDLYDKEMLEATVIGAYLPAQLSIGEIQALIGKIIKESGASGIKDMGKVMGIATKELAGKADGKTISEIVKTLLS